MGVIAAAERNVQGVLHLPVIHVGAASGEQAGSSVRLTLAPIFFGRVWRSSSATSSARLLGHHLSHRRAPLAKARPLLGVVPADHGGAALLDAADLGQ